MSIKVTTNAWTKMKTIMQSANNNYGFLFAASTGGCNGFNFNLNLIDKHTRDELNATRFVNIIENKPIKLYIDPMSEMHLMGTTIDYVSVNISNGVFESKFVYDIDKGIASKCGCGTSFMPKDIRI